MLENEAKDGTFFIIPAATGIIYAYALRVVDISARKNGMEAPDYDLENIDNKIPKKYTEEFIDKQIEETRSMKILDVKNTIRGTKGEDSNLYEQLDKTITMKPITMEIKRKYEAKNNNIKKEPIKESVKEPIKEIKKELVNETKKESVKETKKVPKKVPKKETKKETKKVTKKNNKKNIVKQ